MPKMVKTDVHIMVAVSLADILAIHFTIPWAE